MPLEDSNCIDIIGNRDDGGLVLIITDAGITTDPPERRSLYQEKLKAYVNYVISEEFTQDYPEVPRDKVSILAVCKTPPDEQLAAITRVNPRGDASLSIPVSFQLFDDEALDGGDDVDCGEPATPVPTPRQGVLVRRLVATLFILVGAIAMYRSIKDGWAVPPMVVGCFFLFAGIGLLGTIRKP